MSIEQANTSPINLKLTSSQNMKKRPNSAARGSKMSDTEKLKIGQRVADQRRAMSALRQLKPVEDSFKKNKEKFCMPLGMASARELELQFEQNRQDKLNAKNKNKKKP